MKTGEILGKNWSTPPKPRLGKNWYLAITLIAFLLILFGSVPGGLPVEGRRCLAVFLLCIICWTTNLLPVAVTSLLGMSLLIFLGVLDSREVFGLFGNETVFFLLGAFILAASLIKTGLSARMAFWLLTRFQDSPSQLLLGTLLSTAFLSCWIPQHIVVTLLFPVMKEISESLQLEAGNSSYGTTLFLALAWGASMGGIATFLGGARNILAVGILKEFSGQGIAFLEWVLSIWPLVIWDLMVAYLLLSKGFTQEVSDIKAAISLLQEKQRERGRISLREKKALLILILTIISWALLVPRIGLATIAMASVVAIFITNTVSWKDIEEQINWEIILMYGGILVLGGALVETGAGQWAIRYLISHWHPSPFTFILILVMASLCLTEVISNSAVVAIVLPLALSTAQHYLIDPKIVTYAVAVPAGLAVILPLGTPAMALCYASGFVKLRDILPYGVLLTLNNLISFLLMSQTYWKLIGISP